MSFNPTTKQNWIYKRFYETRLKAVDTHYFKTTFKDNPFLAKGAIKEIQGYKDYDYNLYRVMGLGEWGNILSGQEMYKSFKPEKNVGNYKYEPNKPIHISIDENVIPYLSCLITQLEGKEVKVLMEYTLEDPFNTIRDLCNYILKDFEHHTGGLFLYGDATSKKRDTKIERGSNMFYMIMDYLKVFHPQLRVPAANPSVSDRCHWIDEIFYGLHEIKIKVDSSCVRLIDDLQNVKQASDGTKFKEKVNDPKTHIRYEVYGHLSDALEYVIVEAYRNEYETFRKPGGTPLPKPAAIIDRRW